MENSKRAFLAMISVLVGMGLALLLLRPEKNSARPGGGPVHPSGYMPGATPPPGPDVPGGPIVEPPSPDPNAPERQVTIYTLRMTEDDTTLAPKMVTLAEDAPRSERGKAEKAIELMAQEKESPLPAGTRALSVVFEKDLATVDLSPEFKSHFSGSDKDELLAVNALTATMGQFSGIRRVQLLIDGNVVDSLGGMMSLRSPIPVPQKNGDTPESAGGGKAGDEKAPRTARGETH